ncbi:murein biosynthesis integral membrane protein MurJ [Pseudomonadota bacterium]
MQIFKSAFVIGFFTLISRILGFIRDILIAKFIGAGLVSDAFFAAFKIPNFFRKIFAEGAFNSAFIPLFSESLVDKKSEPAKTFAINLFSLLLYILLILVLIMELFMPTVIKIFIPGFIGNSEKFNLTVQLARITFPYLLFISLVSLFSGILNSLNKFAAVSATPIILNVTFIFFILFLRDFGVTFAYTISYAVFVGGLLQLLWIFIFSVKSGYLLYPKIPKITKKTKEFFQKLLPGIIGAGVMQINLLIDIIMATTIAKGVSYLYYGDRITQFPLALIGTGLGIILLPTLSKQFTNHEYKKAKETQSNALIIALLFGLPAAFALLIIPQEIISTLFERGEFTPHDTIEISKILKVYAFGLPMFIMAKIFTPAFFAEKDTKTPMKIAMICLVINASLNIAFIKPFGYVGIAMATVISSFFNVSLLISILKKRKLIKLGDYFFNDLIKIFYSCIIMLISLIFMQNKILPVITLYSYELKKTVDLMLLVTSGGIIYFSIILISKISIISGLISKK